MIARIAKSAKIAKNQKPNTIGSCDWSDNQE